MFYLLGQLIFGLIVGAIARLIMPGKDPGGFVVTALIGLLGSLIGSFVGRLALGSSHFTAGWVVSILGAIFALTVYWLMEVKIVNTSRV